MQTTIDDAETGQPAPRSRGRWLAALAAVAAAVVAVVLIQVTRDAPRQETSFSQQLSDRVVRALEETTLNLHADHDHSADGADGEASELVCAASTFGFDPPDATTVAEVRTIYAHHMCAAVGPGLGWPDAIRASGPVAVELTDPVIVRWPETNSAGLQATTYADKVRALIPERLHEEALAHQGFVDPEVAGELRQRFEARSG
ncbi:MAG TPA: hypothetical protein VKZ74_08650 [Natronosporangium sp.]|nr:hypothetical protein [Natronosporangium sp.]